MKVLIKYVMAAAVASIALTSLSALAQVKIEDFHDACMAAFEKGAPKTAQALTAIQDRCRCIQPAIRAINGRIAQGQGGAEAPLVRQLTEGDFLPSLRQLQAATHPAFGGLISRCLER